MAWELVAQRGDVPWAQWIDRAAADAWREVVADWFAAELVDPARVGGVPPFPDQVAATRALVGGLGNLSRALDFPVQSFEPWARMLLFHDQGTDPLLNRDGQPAIDYPPSDWRLSAFARMARESEDLRQWTNPYTIELYHRVGLTRDGVLVAQNINATGAPDTPRGVDYQRADAGTHGGTFWNGGAWCEWYPGALEAERNAWFTWLCPLEWHWTQAQQSARLVAGHTVEELVTRCRGYIAAKNLMTAQAVGGDLPEDIMTAASRALALHEGIPTEVHVMGAVITGLAAIAGPLGVALGGVAAGILEALYAIFGRAVSYQSDLWGRREPVLEVIRLTGMLDTTTQHPPTHRVAMPTAADRRPSRYPRSATIPVPIPPAEPGAEPEVVPPGGGAPQPHVAVVQAPEVDAPGESITGGPGVRVIPNPTYVPVTHVTEPDASQGQSSDAVAAAVGLGFAWWLLS